MASPRAGTGRSSIKWLAGAAVAAPILKSAASGATYAARAARAYRQGTSISPGVPAPEPSIRLAGAVAVDALFMLPMGLLTSITPERAYEEASSELDAAIRFYESNGWLNDPSGYFQTPSAPPDVEVTHVRRRSGAVEVNRFPSDWVPHAGEPGGERWLSFSANRDVYARVLRHEGGPRPWLVAVHGAGMGRIGDIASLRVRRLHEELGINVVLPVLPLHGPRRAGIRPDQMFVSNVYPVNNVLGLSQSMWDLRRLLAWLREHEEAPSIGVLGLSLGSYACSLLSTLDGDLACAIAIVPSGDMAEPLRAAEPLLSGKRRAHRAVHDWRSTLAHRVVSPLVRPCLVPKDRRFIIAGQGDQVAPPAGAALLWRHWDEPAILWRPRGHLTTARSSIYDDHVESILRSSGLSVR